MRSVYKDIEIMYCHNGAPIELDSEDRRQKWEGAARAANDQWKEAAKNEARILSTGQVDKPDWFRSAERSARKFVRGLGLEACRGVQVSLIDISTPELQEASRLDMEWDAFHSRNFGVVVRDKAAQAVYEKSGRVGIGQWLSHELTHAAQMSGPALYTNFVDGTWRDHYRTGLSLMDADDMYGQFFTEAIAEYNAGLYARRAAQADEPLASVDALSTSELPEHYTLAAIKKSEPGVNGPDGWAIELVAAWHEQMTPGGAAAFMGHAYDTYSIDADRRLAGHRGFRSQP